jgi:hypothetical protein
VREAKVDRTRDKSAVAPKPSAKSQIDLFLDAAAKVPQQGAPQRGRLIFGFDATMSRQATWDLAQHVQGRMFEAAAAHGGLEVQLVYYRGFGECRASKFVAGGQNLASLMAKIRVAAGRTQIERVLRHVLDEARQGRVNALVFVGDAMEEEIEDLLAAAGEIGLLGVKAFLFQEGRDKMTEEAFRRIAVLTGGAYAAFDLAAPGRLAALLSAAAAYAAGGRPALELEARGEGMAPAQLLLAQLR